LRGYTRLSQTKTSATISEVLDAFYDECAEAIWEHDGLLNETMGDTVMAIFNFPIRHEDHPRRAVLAAQDIQRRWAQRLRSLRSAQGSSGVDVGVGVGIDYGDVSFGEFGRTHQDLTAIGTVVNRASRAQSAASSGEILVTGAVRDRVPAALEKSASQVPSLKGFDSPITLWGRLKGSRISSTRRLTVMRRVLVKRLSFRRAILVFGVSRRRS
jgi:class 3 adenylate cyclase